MLTIKELLKAKGFMPTATTEPGCTDYRKCVDGRCVSIHIDELYNREIFCPELGCYTRSLGAYWIYHHPDGYDADDQRIVYANVVLISDNQEQVVKKILDRIQTWVHWCNLPNEECDYLNDEPNYENYNENVLNGKEVM